MAQKTAVSLSAAGLRLSREVRQAVHSGDGYDDYVTMYQFEHAKMNELNHRIARMEQAIQAFYDDGGEISQQGDLDFTISYDSVRLHIIYDTDGQVSAYSVEGMRGRRATVKRILGLFFSIHLLPYYRQILDTTEDQLKDIDNDNVLKGISEIRDLIRGDKYLTTAAISSVGLSQEEGEDPFGILTGDGGEGSS